MRRVFIIRKDLHLKPGKLAAMVAHCAEAYWTNLLRYYAAFGIEDNEFDTLPAVDHKHPDNPALYRHPKLYDLAEKAFNEGKKSFVVEKENAEKSYTISFIVPKDVWNDYVLGIFTKTICEARNLNQLKKAETLAQEQKLIYGIDYGYINDNCLTDLKPENDDGTCTVGIWFRPLPDEIAHSISKKFPLYRD